MLGNFSGADFFSKSIFKKFFQEHYQSVTFFKINFFPKKIIQEQISEF